MTKKELTKILDFLDTEFAAGAAKMTNDDKIRRIKHWSSELGDYRYVDVMEAIRDIIMSGFPPKTGQIRGYIKEKNEKNNNEISEKRNTFLLWKSISGEILIEIEDDYGRKIKRKINEYEPWQIIKKRWEILRDDESSLDWENVIMACEHKQNWKKVADDILIRIINQSCMN